MTKQSVAQPAPRTSREDRARELASRHHHEIAASKDGHEYLVPSCTGANVYRVFYDPRGEAFCECPDHQYRNNVCKHILAAAIVASRPSYITPADLEAIAELSGIPYPDLSASFAGERRNLALDVVKAAIEAQPGGGPEAWGEHCRSWAKASARGHYGAEDPEPPTFPTYDGFLSREYL